MELYLHLFHPPPEGPVVLHVCQFSSHFVVDVNVDQFNLLVASLLCNVHLHLLNRQRSLEFHDHTRICELDLGLHLIQFLLIEGLAPTLEALVAWF